MQCTFSFTSLGSTTNTVPNPLLRRDDGGWNPAWMCESWFASHLSPNCVCVKMSRSASKHRRDGRIQADSILVEDATQERAGRLDGTA